MRLSIKQAIFLAALAEFSCLISTQPGKFIQLKPHDRLRSHGFIVSVKDGISLLARGKLPKFGETPHEGPSGPKPAPVVVGTAGGEAGGAGGRASRSFDELKTSGVKYTGELDTAISENTADKVIGGAGLTERYSVDIGAKGKAFPDVRSAFGGTQSRTFSEWTVRNKANKDGTPLTSTELQDPMRIISQFSISKEEGILVNDVSFADRDALQGSADYMRFSDQCADALKQSNMGKDMKFMMQRHVTNADTKAAVSKTYADNGWALSQKKTFGPDTDLFKGIMGSDNGRPFVYLLKDNHQYLGNKKVGSIEVDPKGDAGEKMLIKFILTNA